MSNEVSVSVDSFYVEIELEENSSEEVSTNNQLVEIDVVDSLPSSLLNATKNIDVDVLSLEPSVEIIHEGAIVYVNNGGGGAGEVDRVTPLGTAGQALSGHRVVAYLNNMTYASNAIDAHGRTWLYLTNQAMSFGQQAIVISEGLVTEVSWDWTPGATLYLGLNGYMTQTPPNSGEFSRIVGWAESSTKIYFEPQIAVFLA